MLPIFWLDIRQHFLELKRSGQFYTGSSRTVLLSFDPIQIYFTNRIFLSTSYFTKIICSHIYSIFYSSMVVYLCFYPITLFQKRKLEPKILAWLHSMWLGCIFKRNYVYSGSLLSKPAELCFPMSPGNGKGTIRNAKGMCLYQRYSWSLKVLPT